MKTELEKYIQNHRESFDDYEPSEKLWQNIEGSLQKPAAVYKINFLKWAAAAVIILALGTTVFFWNKKPVKEPAIAVAAKEANPLPQQDSDKDQAFTGGIIPTDTPDNNYATSSSQAPVKRPRTEDQNMLSDEMYHYTQLIEIKQKQIELLQQNEPELYKKFSRDLEILEKSYDELKIKLDKGLNNEQLLEAMIQNLKMQTELLNRQLEITKHIDNKKLTDEKSIYNL